MNHHSRIGIIIPFFNGDCVIRQCLDSIKDSIYCDTRVFIVDNSPKETRIEEIAEAFSFAHVIKTSASIGFGKACNIGASAASTDGCDVLVFLNQDTILAPLCLSKLIEALNENPTIGVVGPMNWSIGFQEIESFFVRYYISQCPQFIADAIGGQLKPLYFVEHLMGSCIAISDRTFRNLGLFDEIYHMYSEDGDLCRRYRNAGLMLALLPFAHVGHVHTQTSEAGSSQLLRRIRNSGQKFQLKDPGESFFKLLAITFRNAMFDYVRVLSKGQFVLLASFVCDDGRLVSQLQKIYASRQKEHALVEAAKASLASNQPQVDENKSDGLSKATDTA